MSISCVLYPSLSSVRTKYSHFPHVDLCLSDFWEKQKAKKKKRQISYQVCTSSCVSVLITDADKLQHTQEMNLPPALQQKCKSCQVVSVLLWRVYWFLHYLHTENRVLSFCSDQKGVMFEVCGRLVFKMRTRCFSEMDDSPKYLTSIKSLLNMWN